MSFNYPKPPPTVPAPYLGPLGINHNETANLIKSVYLASGAENEPAINNNYSHYFNATHSLMKQSPGIGLVEPHRLLEEMLRGDRVYINRYPEDQRDFIRYFMKIYRNQYKIHYFFKDKSGKLLDDPYYWISHRNTRRSKKQRHRKTRRHH